MNCEEIKLSLHDYADELLDTPSKKEVESHLRTCANCFNEFKRLTIFFEKIKELPPPVDLPLDIVDKLRMELLSQVATPAQKDQTKYLGDTKKIKKEREKLERISKQKSALERKSQVTKKIIKPLTYSHSSKAYFLGIVVKMLPLVLMVAGYLIYDLQKYNSPWFVEVVSGQYSINKSISKNYNWSQNELISTGDNSIVNVAIPKVGVLEISGNSNILLVRAKDGANQISLSNGKIKIANQTEMPDLSIKIGSVELIDRGGEFELVVDEVNNCKLSVKYGFVELDDSKRKYFIDNNYECEIKKGFIPGLPYHVKASEALRLAINEFDYFNGGDAAVEKIIESATEFDMLTLLALIPRVSQLQRQILFQEIANRFPPPESVTRMGILKLDEEMLYRWWAEIEWQI